jgi:hypothetical protein
MAPSVLLYTILFTLDHVPCHKNKYIDIFVIWFSFLIKSNSLHENDIFVIIIDKFTKQYLESLPSFMNIYNLKYKFFFILKKQPKTVMEGCMWKYNSLDDFQYNNYFRDICLYMDIDILINKSFKEITDTMLSNNIYLCEGNSNSHYYFEGIPKNEMDIISNSNLKGLSAGIFAFYGKSIMIDIFNKIIEYNKVETKFETLEQPLFNRAVFNYYIIDKKINTLHFMSLCISHYSLPSNFNTILIDCCGEPGDGMEHYEKIVNVLLMKYLSL